MVLPPCRWCTPQPVVETSLKAMAAFSPCLSITRSDSVQQAKPGTPRSATAAAAAASACLHHFAMHARPGCCVTSSSHAPRQAMPLSGLCPAWRGCAPSQQASGSVLHAYRVPFPPHCCTSFRIFSWFQLFPLVPLPPRPAHLRLAALKQQESSQVFGEHSSFHAAV